MFEVRSGIAKPAHKGAGGATSMRYPLDKMKTGDFFVVPKSEMAPDDDARKFRNRVNQAVRTYKQRSNQKAHLEPGYDEASHTPLDFTVLTLGAPPADNPTAWEEGDVGVWRDS